MFGHDGSMFLLTGIPHLILWIMGEFFAVVLGIWGILKPSPRKRDSLRIGAFPLLFGCVSLAYFSQSDYWNQFWNVSLIVWLSVLPSALGLLIVLRRRSEASVAEPGAGPNGGPAEPPGKSNTGGGPPSVS